MFIQPLITSFYFDDPAEFSHTNTVAATDSALDVPNYLSTKNDSIDVLPSLVDNACSTLFIVVPLRRSTRQKELSKHPNYYECSVLLSQAN